MSSKKGPVSKPGTVGTDMPGALKGDRDNEGKISTNYKGRPRNADPNYSHRPSPDNAQSVSDYAKKHLKERRSEEKEAKKEALTPMSSKKEPVSKPGTVGADMVGALKGDRDNEGKISTNYKGRSQNADPNYSHQPSPDNAQSVSDYAKKHLKERHSEEKEAKKEAFTPMSSKKEPVSKPGTVGTDMVGALKGDRDNEGKISTNYKGRPRNADPNYSHRPSPDNAQSVSDYAKKHLKERRSEEKEAKKEALKK